MDEREYTADWQLYKDGIDYKSSINLFATTNRNERFYAGHHWDGVNTGGLPQVRLNVTKRIVNWKVSQIMSDMLTMRFSAQNSANYDPADPDKIARLQEVAELLSDYAKTRYNITHVMLAGDWLDCEGISRFAKGADTMPLHEEIAYAVHKLEMLRGMFRYAAWTYIKGNHEHRLQAV